MRVLFLTFLFLFFQPTTPIQNVICDSSPQTIYLDVNEMAFFETPNFPVRMKANCEITFIAKNYQKSKVSERNIRDRFKGFVF